MNLKNSSFYQRNLKEEKSNFFAFSKERNLQRKWPFVSRVSNCRITGKIAEKTAEIVSDFHCPKEAKLFAHFKSAVQFECAF